MAVEILIEFSNFWIWYDVLATFHSQIGLLNDLGFENTLSVGINSQKTENVSKTNNTLMFDLKDARSTWYSKEGIIMFFNLKAYSYHYLEIL